MHSTHYLYNNTPMHAGRPLTPTHARYGIQDGYAFDTLFGCQGGTVASPKLVRPAVEHQAEGIEKLLRAGIHT